MASRDRLIFINLPVGDVARAVTFYEAIGAVRNPQFSNDEGACMVVSDVIHVMLLSHSRFADFSPRAIPDAHASAQMLLCLSAESRDAVDAMTVAAGDAGGMLDPCPVQDHGVMYGRSFADPDGHIWEIMWMDMAAAAPSGSGAPADFSTIDA